MAEIRQQGAERRVLGSPSPAPVGSSEGPRVQMLGRAVPRGEAKGGVGDTVPGREVAAGKQNKDAGFAIRRSEGRSRSLCSCGH